MMVTLPDWLAECQYTANVWYRIFYIYLIRNLEFIIMARPICMMITLPDWLARCQYTATVW